MAMRAEITKITRLLTLSHTANSGKFLREIRLLGSRQTFYRLLKTSISQYFLRRCIGLAGTLASATVRPCLIKSQPLMGDRV
jgi:hypothetical protein